jgi:hypothetical protein
MRSLLQHAVSNHEGTTLLERVAPAGALLSPYQRKDKHMRLRSLLRVVNLIASSIFGLIVFREMMKSGKRWKEEWEARREEA